MTLQFTVDIYYLCLMASQVLYVWRYLYNYMTWGLLYTSDEYDRGVGFLQVFRFPLHVPLSKCGSVTVLVEAPMCTRHERSMLQGPSILEILRAPRVRSLCWGHVFVGCKTTQQPRVILQSHSSTR
jgi:hypothetical protein